MDLKWLCKLYSVGFCLCQTYLLLFPMFMLAWSNGSYISELRINMYGEANIEVIFWIVSFPIVMYGFYLNMADILNERLK